MTRETHIKQLDIPASGAAMRGREVYIDIAPALSAEPLVTFYLRRALGYRYIRTVLEDTFGSQELKRLHRLTESGPAPISLAWARRPITVSFARPPQATIRDLKGRPLRDHPPIRWGALKANLQYPVTVELYVDRILNRDEFRKVCDSCGTRSEILRRLDASTNPA